jgi:hypothetical protein
MKWPYLQRGDITGILLVAIVLGAAFLAMVLYPQIGQKQNFGFGPEWECLRMGKGDPICVKRPASPDESTSKN